MGPRNFVVPRFEPWRYVSCGRIGRLATVVLSGLLLASCASLSAFGKALNPFGSDVDVDGEPVVATPPAEIDPAPREPAEDDYITFVQELMAASAELDEKKTRAERAANAAAAWRGAGEQESGADGG